MRLLAESYRAARAPGVTGDGPDLDEAVLETTLAALLEAGRAAHPEIALDDAAAFAAHLARCDAPVSASPGAAHLHAGDLFLVSAALAGNAQAVGALRRDHRPVLARYLRSIDSSPAFLDEVEQRTWALLLVGNGRRLPSLNSYSGRGPLAGFVGISAQRLALLMLRQRGVEARAVERLATLAADGIADAELAFMKEQYRDAFEQSIREALQELDDRARVIFRLHVVDGLTVDRIAKAYGVSQSTVSRWLAAARQRVLVAARRLLRQRLDLPESEFDSVARLLASQIDVSLSGLL
jgi:RNA polymerase sigma-70 factor (ECF subfamily)